MKLCVDCRHHVLIPRNGPFPESHLCNWAVTSLGTDPVTGDERMTSNRTDCREERAPPRPFGWVDLRPIRCGPDGGHFEPKPATPPPPAPPPPQRGR